MTEVRYTVRGTRKHGGFAERVTLCFGGRLNIEYRHIYYPPSLTQATSIGSSNHPGSGIVDIPSGETRLTAARPPQPLVSGHKKAESWKMFR